MHMHMCMHMCMHMYVENELLQNNSNLHADFVLNSFRRASAQARGCDASRWPWRSRW